MHVSHLANHQHLLAVLSLLTVFLWFPNLAQASEQLTLDPAFQEIVLEENQTRAQAVVTYKNDSEAIREIELFARDFTQADALGGVAFITDRNVYPHSLASFLQLDKNRLVIQPGETGQVLVTVENRASLSPGGHYAALVARVVVDSTPEMEQPILPALSSLFLVRKIGGERYHLSLVTTDWQPKTIATKLPSQIELMLRNDGNVHDIPRGTVTATGLGGRIIAQGTVNEESLYVLPGTHRKIDINLRSTTRALPIDFVTVTLHGTGQYSAIAFTWEESVILIAWYVPVMLLVVSAIPLFWYFKIRTKPHAKKP